MRAHESEIRNAGATIATIGLGDINYARLFSQETGITFPLLVDERRLAYRSVNLKNGNLLHLFRKDNFVARKKAKDAGHRQHKSGKNPFQLGASFIFGPGNLDIFCHVNETFGDNASVAKILKVLTDYE